jgi:hypothetical protein
MDESHFEDGGARAFKYSFFFVLALITFLGVWKKDEILGYLSFREHGESRIVIYALSGTSVSVLDEKRNKRELGLVGRDGKFTLVEQGEIESLRIYLYHPYFFPEEKLFERVEKGETITFSAAMAPMYGSLKVRSFPNGATILVDEEEVGKSPWRKKDIRDGTQLYVEVYMTGFIRQSRMVEIHGGKEEELVFSLASTQCAITLETDKEDFSFESIRIFLDGSAQSLDGRTLKFVPPGRHTVEVVAHDGLKLEKELNIKPGQTIRLKLPDWFVDDGS